MKYKVQELFIDSFGNVDIPEGWKVLNIAEKSISTCSEGTRRVEYTERYLITLEPIG